MRGAYLDAIADINRQIEAFYDKWMIKKAKRWELARVDRLDKLKADLEKTYSKYSPIVTENIRQTNTAAFINNYYRQQYAGHLYTDLTYAFTPATERAVAVAVNWEAYSFSNIPDVDKRALKRLRPPYADKRRTKYKPRTLKQVIQANDKKAIKKIKDTITNSILVGRSPRQTAADMRDVVGGVQKNSERIVRTETARLMEAGNYMNSQAMVAQGFDIGRVWDATLDNRTRSQSASMDGQPENESGLFEYPNGALGPYPGTSGYAKYDINERCIANELIDGENPEKRISVHPETGERQEITYAKFNAWATDNGLTRNKYGEPYKF
jgi:hypothetical protein